MTTFPSSFTLVPVHAVPTNKCPDDKASHDRPTVSPTDKDELCDSAPNESNTNVRQSHFVMIPGTDPQTFTRLPRKALSIDRHASQKKPFGHTYLLHNPMPQHRSLTLDDGVIDDSSTVATGSTFGNRPPVSEIHVPVSHCQTAPRGMRDISSDYWRSMYFQSQRSKRRLQGLSHALVAENRTLKRQLIQLHKCINETRRNHAAPAGPGTQPWSVPHRPAPKRQRRYSEQDATCCVSDEEGGSQQNM